MSENLKNGTSLGGGEITPALKELLHQYEDLCAEMEKRRDYLLARATEWGFDPIKPEGSYFFMATFDKLSQKSDMEFMEELIKTKQVALIPASPFYLSAIDEGCRLMRFNFVKSMAALEQADKNMRRL